MQCRDAANGVFFAKGIQDGRDRHRMAVPPDKEFDRAMLIAGAQLNEVPIEDLFQAQTRQKCAVVLPVGIPQRVGRKPEGTPRN